MGQKAGLAILATKKFGKWTFFMKGTHTQMGCGHFVILSGDAPCVAAGLPAGAPRAKNHKLEVGLRTFCIKKIVVDPVLRLFAIMHFFLSDQGLGKMPEKQYKFKFDQ